jgi:hypothetical protein
MGGILGGNVPTAPPVPAPPPPLQSPYGGQAQAAGTQAAQKASQAQGFGSTLVTGAAGLAPAQTTAKSLLGQ